MLLLIYRLLMIQFPDPKQTFSMSGVVNAIAPGLIATESNKMLLQNEEKRMEEERDVPFHRIGQPEEIARIALFLASDDAIYITGSLIYADGGLSLSRSNYFLESKIEQD
jgi:NAD(P)-dependent dehydrogenase (short-subunit alcohol dehydrogenase family)